MKQAATMPDIRKAIISRLQTWINDSDPTHFSSTWPGVNTLTQTQDLLGWRAFLEGCVLKEWAAKQQEYYTWLERKNTGRRWVTTLIKKMWEISWDMWKQRNDELTNPESPASLREHARLDAIIHLEYADLQNLANRDRRWFRRPPEVVATESIEYKQQWIESVGLARARYARRHARRNNLDLQAERIAMRNFLRQVPNLTA
jgi:hypothetical protein